MKSTTLVLNGVKYQYHLFGRGKKTVVILHGLMADKSHMGILKQMFPKEPLFRKYRVLIPDLPGHGGLPVCAGGDVCDYVDYLISLFEYLKLKDFALVGFSFGGVVSLKISMRYKKRIPLVLWASPVAATSPIVKVGIPLLDIIPSKLYYALLNTSAALAWGKVISPVKGRRVLESARKFDKSLLRHLKFRPDPGALASTNPKLFIFGTQDPYIGDGAAERLLKLKPKNSLVITVRQGGHAWTKEGAKESLRQIRLFLFEKF